MIFTLLFQVLLAVFTATSAEHPELPDVTLQTFEGENLELRAYTASKKVRIVSLWANWCVPCKKELNALSEVYSDWQSKYDIELIAISVDDKRGIKRAKKYAEKQGWGFTLLHDYQGEMMTKLGIQAIPYSLLIDARGHIVSRTEGYYEGYEAEMEKKIKKLIK